MTAPTLDYGRPARWQRDRWWLKYAAGAAALLLVASVSLTSKSVVTQIDSVTGTTQTSTRWPLGVTTGPRVSPTPLEARLTAAGIMWTPTWQFFGERGVTLYGRTFRYGCGRTPAAYTLGVFRRPEYWETMTDADLRGLVLVLQTGTEDQQRAAVAAVEEKLLAGLD